jgi:hypothetical protein
MPLKLYTPLVPAVHALGWLVPGENCTELGYRIVERAWRDIGIMEVPEGSNRGIRIDRYTKASGLTPPQWWCAIFAGRVLIDCGSLVPISYPGTDYWLPHVERKDQGARPQIGDVVIYGTWKAGPVVKWGNAHHAGIIVRLPEPGQPRTYTVEGNRAFAGTTSNNGLAVDFGPMIRTDVLGYFRPRVA